MKGILWEQRTSGVISALLTAAAGGLLLFWPDRSVNFLCSLLGAALLVIGLVYILGCFARRRGGVPVWFLIPGIILAAVGLNLSTYQNMSNAQISAALKGGVIESKGYSSTSFNIRDNPFISGSQSGGREVYLHIKAPKNTKVVGGNPAQAECILDKGTKMQITGAHFDGSYAYPRAGGVVKRVIVDVEIIP